MNDKVTKERFTSVPTAEEYALFREAYAETYPVRPLLNAIDAKDAEIERLTEKLDEALSRNGALVLIARQSVQEAHDFVAQWAGLI